MKKGIKYYLGTHNFTAMRAASCTAKSPIRTISKAEIKKRGEKYLLFLNQIISSKAGKINGWVSEICW